MKKLYTPKEMTEALSRMTILCDTREQQGDHVTAYFDKVKRPWVKRALKTGDYSAMLDGYTLEDDVVVERKGGLDELSLNLGVDRDRFEREMIRAKAAGTKIILLVEGASWEDISAHNYRSKLTPKSFTASLLKWQAEYNVSIIFCDKRLAGEMINGMLYYWAKTALEGNL